MIVPHSSSLPAQFLADLFQQLSRLEQAGFPAIQTFELLEKSDLKYQQKINELQQLLRAGKTVSEAGFRARIFSSFDKALLAAGEVGGKSAVIYQQLADYYGDRARRIRQIKSRLYLPALILILALFIQPLPALILNEITGLEYISITIGTIIRIALALYIIIKLPSWLTTGWLRFLGLEKLVYQLQLNMPLISDWIIRRQLNTFFSALGMLLSTGLPASDALSKATGTIKNTVLKTKFLRVSEKMNNGESLALTLSMINEIDPLIINQVDVGEQSGRLAETLLHITKIDKQSSDLQETLLAEWIPRVFYLIVVIWLATSLIGSKVSSTIAI